MISPVCALTNSIAQFVPVIAKEDGYANCSAEAYADSIIGSASDNAIKILSIAENLCEAGDPQVLYEAAHGFVETYVDTFTDAYTQCVGTGGDPNYDGGCAMASAYAGTHGIETASAT